MRLFAYFLRYAVKQLWSGGQRVLIAVLAVSFGVMSLIAMSSLSDAVNRTYTDDARIAIGGDLLVYRPDEMLDAAALQTVQELQARGLISVYSPVSAVSSVLLRTQDSGRVRFVERADGVDPDIFPLVGQMIIGAPQGASFAELLAQEGDAVITRDIAHQYNLAIGDVLRIAQFEGETFGGELLIKGIVDDTPYHKGQRIYYNLATAQTLVGSEAAFDYVLIMTEDSNAVAEAFTALGWEVMRADLMDIGSPSENFFNLMLRGAGVLGLLVGGIGIANTMQVLLAQRRREVAILKTLGASRRNMLLIFLLEALILGFVGSLIGGLAALGLGRTITDLLANSSTFLVKWEFSAILSIGGVFTGVMTTVLFALYAILRASRISPSVIFRQELSMKQTKLEWLGALSFFLLLSLPFTVITTFIMGSVFAGIGILIVAFVGLISFSILLGLSTWLILRFMPNFGSNMLRMARNNMRKRAFSMLFAMIAIFVGIFTMGFSVTIIQVGFDEFSIRQDKGDGPNLLIYADEATAEEIRPFLAAQGGRELTQDRDSVQLGMYQGQVAIYARVDEAAEQAIAERIGEQFPQSMTITRTDVMLEANRLFMNLLLFALAMSGLALLAGLMLVANVVSLAMIERRYEIGVMKAVGYTQRHILSVLGLEYGLIGFIASLLGLLAVQVTITIITRFESVVEDILVMNPLTAVLILALGVTLTLLTALLSAWQPTRKPPLLILNENAG